MKRIAKFMVLIFALASACIFLLAGDADAAVGLCVKDDSLSKVSAVNTGDTTSGWDGGWGTGWTVRSTNGQYIVDGTATCLNTSTKNGKTPSSWMPGLNCWCNVTRINDKAVSGAWVLDTVYPSIDECSKNCALLCPRCVYLGTDYSCTRSALFAPL
ncbi:MAG: hypothetical protein LBL21_00060 [Rickettsiales bacterium]|jgi:hypothetical protein|nr:hypothetical protein [Rickettsiales bacterium]